MSIVYQTLAAFDGDPAGTDTRLSQLMLSNWTSQAFHQVVSFQMTLCDL